MKPQRKPRKVRNEEYYEAMVELRHGNAAQPHKNRAKYDRKRSDREWRKEYI